MTQEAYLNGERVAELWTAVRTALAGKADREALNNYTTPDAVATAITSALSGYATSAGVRTQLAAALADYMTAREVDDALAGAVARAAHLSFAAVDALPEAGEANVIYLVPSGAQGDSQRDEFMWLDGRWERIGSAQADLSGYWDREQLRPMSAEELQAILV